MGLPMAKNILKSGFKLKAFNRSIEKAEPLKEFGAEISKSINSVSSVWNNTDVLKKIDSLERKRDMLVFGNNALQAMGIFID